MTKEYEVSANRKSVVKVTISEDDVDRIITTGKYSLRTLMKANWATISKKIIGEPDGFIKKGKWYHNVEYHTSHSWDVDEFIRDATPQEIELYDNFQALKHSLLLVELIK